MAKVTSKYQVTVPKAIADKYGICPGDEIAWLPAGDSIRVIPSGGQTLAEGLESRLRLFDQATERHRKRVLKTKTRINGDRGWKREDLYERGRSD